MPASDRTRCHWRDNHAITRERAMSDAPANSQVHQAEIQQLAHDANLLFYGAPEAKEGREAYKEKRRPDFSKFPRRA